ncbi:cbb3-type cytochrome oxidase assembly protein CcoS [Pseudosulfitobacter koreensis]|uniref:Cbb3-type cytochrome oxidase assembly protein CcoS n=1 Tax=Pseudosulfitobacter koreensis TaxID=2968472 RepID=A0ABT1Z4X7_9RHOB|nr:cbb3-type cytochrome oxidase assembly protein CcoS [Pseudosulfitobacter koreense]MCR8828196.1 cbb3-type cytochrome oxidase assembly protein CcoS [Pseudosulfitobacter koreense]
MTILYLLIPVTILMGLTGLGAFFWTLKSHQYEDLAGDAERILHDDDTPMPPRKENVR